MAYYWYDADPDLYRAEVAAMRRFFPSFKINQLEDGSGRLYWRGKVRPGKENPVAEIRFASSRCSAASTRPPIAGAPRALPNSLATTVRFLVFHAP